MAYSRPSTSSEANKLSLEMSLEDYISGRAKSSSLCLSDVTTNRVSDVSNLNDFNEEWNGVEHHIPNPDIEDGFCLGTGAVTQVVSDREIVIDGQRIKFERNYITDLSTDDLVNVVVGMDNKVTVKALRYKIITAKITKYEKNSKRFIFSDKAFIRNTSLTESLTVGDVKKCVVIASQDTEYKWRAYPLELSADPSANTEARTEYNTEELMANKNGIEIIDEITFGEMRVNNRRTVFVLIKNKGTKSQTLISVDNEEGENQISFHAFHGFNMSGEPPFLIKSESNAFVELICDSEYCGEHNILIVFQFKGFRIGRFVSMSVKASNPVEQNHFQNQFLCGDYPNLESADGNSFDPLDEEIEFIPGEKPWNPKQSIDFVKLDEYKIPKNLWNALEKNSSIEAIFPELRKQFNKFSFRQRFHSLLFLEECENQINLSKYNMKGVRLRTDGYFIAITVPGLADGRPSLIIGDSILVFDQKVTDERRRGYQGFVHEVRTEEILIRFGREVHKDFTVGLFDVKFMFSRTVTRRCHHAIDLATYMMEEVLFPDNISIKAPLKKIPMDSINWFNTSLNMKQKLAAVGALRGESRPTPYIIFGPPGTGKTVTIVESILQVFTNISKSRVIACTADNSSANLIAQKLLDSNLVTNQELIRIKAFHRETPKQLESITQIAGEDQKKWLFHRIIVTTTSQAGVIFKHKLSSKHFTHAFIDEAAQVSEPESLIPIVMSAMSGGVVVLAGDHKQLGPVIFSRKAREYGLHVSLMERLINSFKPYKKDEKFEKYGYYNPKFLVKLVDNYRSVEEIMKIPSQLFYENELIFNTQTDSVLIRSLNLRSAVNFVAVEGVDQQGRDIPSWFNMDEVREVYQLLIKLHVSRVDPKDIGIITPYRKQVMAIRDYIRENGWSPSINECRVGTIEEFQGLEKRVIIVSMVRSTKGHLQHDMKHSLGFLHNPKRFNVAISRAMALLIVIGSHSLLSMDSNNWLQFIEHCNQMNS